MRVRLGQRSGATARRQHRWTGAQRRSGGHLARRAIRRPGKPRTTCRRRSSGQRRAVAAMGSSRRAPGRRRVVRRAHDERSARPRQHAARASGPLRPRERRRGEPRRAARATLCELPRTQPLPRDAGGVCEARRHAARSNGRPHRGAEQRGRHMPERRGGRLPRRVARARLAPGGGVLRRRREGHAAPRAMPRAVRAATPTRTGRRSQAW